MAPKRALITGITGQDGSYLAELLLNKNYKVHGLIRRTSLFNTSRIDHLLKQHKNENLFLHYGDLSDGDSVKKIINAVSPDEVYNLGAQSHVRISFDIEEQTLDVTGLGVLRILQAIKGSKARLYQASSSEMFGSSPPPQNEQTPFYPRSPYGCAKVLAFHLCRFHREAYGTFAVNGILFNHESERRGENFVTRKITIAVARIKAGLDKELHLGNLDAQRDWGYAPEYMEAAWLMIQQNRPDDFVIGTGETHSVKEFVELAFEESGLGDYRNYVKFDDRLFRPAEVNVLLADSSKAKEILDWKPKTSFRALVRKMVEADICSIAKLLK